MAITYTPVSLRGQAAEPVFAELLFRNNTIADELVRFEENIKAGSIISEFGVTVTRQAYTSGAPTAAGSINPTDKEVTPIKQMYYDEFDPDQLRPSRYNRDMAAGAWNVISGEFMQMLMESVAPKIALQAEVDFWNGASSATKTAVAALTPGTGQGSVGAAEQTYVAAAPTSLFDGIVTTLIYNSPNAETAAGVGARVKVAGTTITSSNIATEYAKLYAAIPAVLFNPAETGGDKPYIYAPYSHKQLINIFNVTATYRDLFSVEPVTGKYFYNSVEIKFVPVPENCMIVSLPNDLVWCTDLLSDLNLLNIDKIANNREDMFYKAIFTELAWVVRQKNKVLYLG